MRNITKIQYISSLLIPMSLVVAVAIIFAAISISADPSPVSAQQIIFEGPDGETCYYDTFYSSDWECTSTYYPDPPYSSVNFTCDPSETLCSGGYGYCETVQCDEPEGEGGCTPSCGDNCGSGDGCGGVCGDACQGGCPNATTPGMCGNCDPSIPGDCPVEPVYCPDTTIQAPGNDVNNCVCDEPTIEYQTVSCPPTSNSPWETYEEYRTKSYPNCSPYGPDQWSAWETDWISYSRCTWVSDPPSCCWGLGESQCTTCSDAGNFHSCSWNAQQATCDYGGPIPPPPPGMSGDLIPASASCTIPLNGTSCNINFSWDVTDAEDPGNSAVTKAPNVTVGTGDSGSQSFTIPYGGETFYLYNNAVELDSETVGANCGSNFWNGSTCIPTPPGPMTGTLTPAAPSCTISSGGSGCNINFSWVVNNPVGASTVTRDGTGVVGNGHTGGPTPLLVPYNAATFRLMNGTTQLDLKNVFSACTSGTHWGGTSCIPNTGGPGGGAGDGNPATDEMTATCIASPLAAKINQTVIWTAQDIVGGNGNYSYSWSGTDIPAFGFSGPGLNQYSVNYPTEGLKNINVLITDTAGNSGHCTGVSGFGPAAITIHLRLPTFIEE